MTWSRRLSIAVCILALSNCAAARRTPFDGSPRQLAEELALVRDAIRQAHPGVDRYVPRAVVDSAFDATAAGIREPMSRLEWQKRLARYVASIRDGHTAILSPKDTIDRLDARSTAAPFRVLVRDDTLYVQNDLTDRPDGSLLGARIVSIQGHPVAEFLAAYDSIAPVEARVATRARRMLESVRTLTRYLAILYGIRESYSLEYVPFGQRASRSVVLPALPFDQVLERLRARYPAGFAGPARFEFLPSRIARLQIATFDRDQLRDGKIEFERFLEQSFRRLRDEHATGLVLDLRDNGGGTDEYGALVARHLVTQDFRYYRRLGMNQIHYRFFAHTPTERKLDAPAGFARPRSGGGYDVVRHPNLGILHPAEPTWSGPLVVLLNGRSFSTTCELISVLAENTGARFVGEEGGGAFGGNCSGPTPTLELPYSGIRLEIPLVRYEMAVSNRRPRDRGVLPDLEVRPTVEDVRGGRDPLLEAAAKLLAEAGGR